MEAPAGLRLALVFAVLVHFSLLPTSYSLSSQDLQIVSAERRIDLTSHITRVYLTLKVENTGTSPPASEILLAFPPTEVDHIALLKAAVTVGKKKKKSYLPLDVKPSEGPEAPNETKFFTVLLLNPLSVGESLTLEVLYVLTHSLEPFPLEISQSEPQLVYYHDSAILLSPYHIKQQITVIKTPSTKVESFSRVEPTDHAGTELKYGPYEDRSPYSFSPIIIHFENNNPFAVVEELVREVEISHWGSLQITEHYKLVQLGLNTKVSFQETVVDKLTIKVGGVAGGIKKPFCHSSFSSGTKLGVEALVVYFVSVNALVLICPEAPTSYSYLDVVGRTVVVLEKKNVVPEHNSPFQDVLVRGTPTPTSVSEVMHARTKKPRAFTLASWFLRSIVKDSCEFLGYCLVVNAHRYFSFKLSRVFEERLLDPKVYYNFNPIFMLAEPLMLASVFFFLFVACVAYLHIDLSIRK
ncbi:hypothetical protein C3L33_02771, partial [Rhododendron williamsianum]